MKIIFIFGMSGVGKTTIAQKLCTNNKKYNLISSYTDRAPRKRNEYGHIFVTSNHMDMLLDSDDVVASTEIDGYRYCALKSQFSEDKINIYIIDLEGYNTAIKNLSNAQIMTVLIKRNKIEADCVRQNRDVLVPLREDVDFVIENDYKIKSAVDLLNALSNFDFYKPPHIVESAEDKLEDINRQCRYLNDLRISIYKQIWKEKFDLYKDMAKKIEEKLNNDFDFDIKVIYDASPDIDDEYLVFNLILEYNEDLDWSTTHTIVSKASYYAHTCFKGDERYKSIVRRLRITEYWKGQEEFL